MKTENVVIMGMGYIGLPTAALIASKGIKVHGVDVNEHVVNTINHGKIHIVEPELEGLVEYVVNHKYLTTHLKPQKADVFMIAVPTPFKDGHKADISFVLSAAEMIIPFLESGNLVILESTSPVGTTEIIANLVYKKRPELTGKLSFAYCPERVLPGRVIFELESNDRAIGGVDANSTEKAVEFYSRFVKGVLHGTTARTAEMCKLVENSYRDVNIAFANEVSILCEKMNVNTWELIRLANKHPRVKILTPGCGVGGHCIAVDPWFLVENNEKEALVIKAARDRNNGKTDWILQKIETKAAEFNNANGRNPIIACMGLAFKPDIDDLRESPAKDIYNRLSNKKYSLLAVEPNLSEHKTILLTPVSEALAKADILVFLVNHREFATLDKNSIKGKIVVDVCGVYDNR